MLRRNAALKITALLLAVFLWFYVRLTEENPFVEKTLRVPVAIRDLPANLAVAHKPPAVEVVVRGPKAAVESAASQVRAWVGLKKAGAGACASPVRVQLPAPLTRVRVRPERVSLGLERRVSKSLLVEYYLLGSAPPGYAIGDPRVEPARVTVSGVARDVDRVAHALVSVDVAYARIGISRAAHVRAVDANGTSVPQAVIAPSEVQVTVPVRRVAVYRTVPVLLRTTGSLAGGCRIARIELRPAVVTVAGDAARIREVKYVETEPLDLEGAKTSISRAIRLITPRGVTALGAQQVRAEIEIVEGQ